MKVVPPFYRLERTDRQSLHKGNESFIDFLPGLRKYFLRRVTDFEAEDLVQEVCLRMAARPQTATIDNMQGYLFRVAANVFNERARTDQVRHRSSHIELTEDNESADEITPERIILQREQLNAIITIIQELPPRTRDAFILHRFEEMTYEAIANKMGISSSGVEKHIMKALRHLTARLTRSAP